MKSDNIVENVSFLLTLDSTTLRESELNPNSFNFLIGLLTEALNILSPELPGESVSRRIKNITEPAAAIKTIDRIIMDGISFHKFKDSELK